jgi:hypothetical protein
MRLTRRHKEVVMHDHVSNRTDAPLRSWVVLLAGLALVLFAATGCPDDEEPKKDAGNGGPTDAADVGDAPTADVPTDDVEDAPTADVPTDAPTDDVEDAPTADVPTDAPTDDVEDAPNGDAPTGDIDEDTGDAPNGDTGDGTPDGS